MKKKEIKKEAEEIVKNLVVEDKVEKQFTTAETAHKEVRDNSDFPWTERDSLFRGKYKNPQEPTKSIYSTGELTNLAIDSTCRVMAQMPSGRFQNFNGKTGANMLMNLLFEHYVIPNATSGGPLLLKKRLVNLWSNVFPGVPVFIDWIVDKKRGYIGPDMILLHPRRFRPQPGKIAIEDMDYCFIDTDVSREWLESRNKEYWKNIDEVINEYDKEDEGSGTPEEDRSPNEKGKTKTGITIRHKLSSNGDWLVFDVASKKVLLDEENYFPGIPIAIKRQFPTLDELWSITNFDRGQTGQKSIDTITRLTLDGVDMSINPPATMDPDQVVLSSIVRQPKAKWFVKNGAVDAIHMQNVSPQGLSTFQGVYGTLKANLLSQGASSDTSIAKSVDAGFGKTPEALKMQGERQGARDVWDSYMQEIFSTRVYEIMANMIAKKGIKKFAFQLLGTSIQRIKDQYPDSEIDKLVTKDDSEILEIDPEEIRGQYRYIYDSGSTGMKKDDTGDKLIGILKLYSENEQIKEDLARAGKKVDFGEAFKRIVLDQGIQDAEKIIVDAQNPESIEGIGNEGATIQQDNVEQEPVYEDVQQPVEMPEQQLMQQQ